MRPLTFGRRLAVRAATAAFAVVVAVGGVSIAVGGAYASVTRTAKAGPGPVKNPYSPAYRHAYRHGVVPTRAQYKKMQQWASSSGQAFSANDLNYGGGIDGIGVTTGQEKVYLVFYGSQWGTQGTDGSGNVTLSGDPSGEAPYLQQLIKGLGTSSELWSGVMTQYCDGVAAGAQSCPASNAEHVAYPAGAALAGVWLDESNPSPVAASGHQLGVEAVSAATHFGNTTAAANRDAQYVILSPTGTDPDNYQTGGFCAWHDYTGDSTLSGGAVSSPDGDIAFTNLPYIPDAGYSCGQGFVNSPGDLDGVSIVEGHEYAETITDQNPAGGWTDSSGAETGDKCAWINPGTSGGAFDLTLATGIFAMQTTWANDGSGGNGACESSHPVVSNGGSNAVTVINPGSQSGLVGTSVSLQLQASDSAAGQSFTWSAAGLPAGLSISSSTGLITGTPTAAGISSVIVSATDTTGASGSTSFTWTVTSAGSCTPTQLLGNPGFETGTAAPWLATAGVINPYGAGELPHSGNWYAWLDGYGVPHTDRLSQTVTISGACHTDTFSFWLWIDTSEATPAAADTLTVQVLSSSGTVLATLATYSNLNANNQYTQRSFNVSAFTGQTITVAFVGRETDTGGGTTDFVIDDTALNQAP